MAKIDYYVYGVTDAETGALTTIRLSFEDAWNLAFEIKQDVDRYGVWDGRDD